MFLYGKNSVLERLKSNPRSIKKIFLQDNFEETFLTKLIKKNNIPTQYLPFRKLVKLKKADKLQGIVAEVDKFEYTSFRELLSRPLEKQPTFIFLDRVQDPQNLGSIIRTAACFGGFAIVIPKFKACDINETVLHVASGGENYLPICLVSNLSNALIAAKKSGIWIVAAVAVDDSEDMNKTRLPRPLGFVLGSEGDGIRQGLNKHADMRAHIPTRGADLSLNVTVACAVFCYEINKQRSG